MRNLIVTLPNVVDSIKKTIRSSRLSQQIMRKSVICCFATLLALFGLLYLRVVWAGDPFGTNLGSFNGVAVFSNGSSSFYSSQSNDVNGIYTGIKWQCVEYVRRYYLTVYNADLAPRYLGNANTWYDNASKMGLERYPNGGATALQVGDILTSNGGPFGHIAIVRSVTDNQVCTIQQNFSNDANDVNRCLNLTVSNGARTVSSFSGSYPIQGWLRRSGSTLPPPCVSGSSENFLVDGRPPVHPNGTLIKKRSDQTYFVLIDGQKRGIPSPDVLHNLYGGENSEFEFNDVITVSDTEFNGYPTGLPVNSPLPSNGKSQPNGRLIKTPGRSEVSIVSDGKRRPFTDANIFTNLGFVFCNVIEVVDYDLYPLGPPVDGKTLPGLNTWTSAGPYGGGIHSIAVNPVNLDVLYAGTYGDGVYKSTDGGVSWSSMNNGLPINASILSLAINPANPVVLYAAIFGGVYKSTDEGASWSPMNNGLPNTSVDALAINPANPAVLYAGTGGGVYKSTDSGAGWNLMNNGLPNTSVDALAINPANPVVLYAGTMSGVYKSTDGGASWSSMNNGLPNTSVDALAINPTNPAVLYAGTGGGGVYKSTDGGANWNVMNNGMPYSSVYTLAINPANPAVLFAGVSDVVGFGGGGFYKSTDGGASWNPINNGLPNSFVSPLTINSTNPAVLYVGTAGGGYKSANGGANWSPMSNGLPNAYTSSLALSPANPAVLYAGTRGSGVHKSTDGGASWSPMNNGLPNSFIGALTINSANPAVLYAGTLGSGIYKSTNEGANWSLMNNGLPNGYVYALAINPVNPLVLYAAIFGGVYKSTDGGANWSPASNGLSNTSVLALAINPVNSAVLYTGTGGGGYKSTDGGVNWSLMSNGLPNVAINALAINPANPAVLYAGGGTGSVIYKSTDEGASWRPVIVPTSYFVSALAINPANPTVLYVGAADTAGTVGGVYKSTDGGVNWSSMNNGLPNTSVYALAISPTGQIVHAGTRKGVFTYRNDGTSDALVVSAISPTTPTCNINDQDVTVSGNGFQQELTVDVTYPGGGTTLTGTQIKNITPTSFVMRIKLAGTGAWSIRVKNLDGSQSNNFDFQVQAGPAPTITSINPLNPLVSNIDQQVTINGTNFKPGLTVTVTFPGGSKTLSGAQILQPVTSNSFKALITFGSPGDWSIHVNNPDCSQSSAYNFKVGSVSCAQPPSGLVAWWSGDGNANDIQGSNNGTLQNDATFAPGFVSQAFNFNGFGDSVPGGFVSIADSASLQSPALTFEGWFFLRRQPSGDPISGFNEFILASKYDGQYHGWVLRVGNDFKPVFSVHRDANPGGSTHAVSSVPVQLNNWVHIAGTYDGNTAKIYVNGLQTGSQLMTGGYTPATVPMKIGTASWYTGGFTDGLIDEVTFYNRALSNAEIQSIFASGSAGKCKGTIPPCTLTCSATVPPNGTVGASVSFSAAATSSSCAGTPTYEWDFGDGAPHSLQQNPTHTYTTPGTYHWIMTATLQGQTGTQCVREGNITISQPEGPKVNLVSPQQGDVAGKVVIQANVTLAPGTTLQSLSYQVLPGSTVWSGTTNNYRYIWDVSNLPVHSPYTVRAIVIDSNNQASQAQVTVTVEPLISGRIRIEDPTGPDPEISPLTDDPVEIPLSSGKKILLRVDPQTGFFDSRHPYQNGLREEDLPGDLSQIVTGTYWLTYADIITVDNRDPGNLESDSLGIGKGCKPPTGGLLHRKAKSIFAITLKQGSPISLDVTFPPPVVMLHGIRACYTRWNDWANYLLETGYIVFTPNYRYAGDLFVAGTNEALDQLDKDLKMFKAIPKLYLICHSRGGVIARLVVANDAERIKKVFTLGTPHSGTDLTGASFYSLDKDYMLKTFNRVVRGFDSRVPVYAISGHGTILGGGDCNVPDDGVVFWGGKFDDDYSYRNESPFNIDYIETGKPPSVAFRIQSFEGSEWRPGVSNSHHVCYSHIELVSSRDSIQDTLENIILNDIRTNTSRNVSARSEVGGKVATKEISREAFHSSDSLGIRVESFNIIQRQAMLDTRSSSSPRQISKTQSISANVSQTLSTPSLTSILSESVLLAKNTSKEFQVPIPSTDLVSFNAMGITSNIKLTLTDPNGLSVLPGNPSAYPTAFYASDEFGEHYAVRNPKAGIWKMTVITDGVADTVALGAQVNALWGFVGDADKIHYAPSSQAIILSHADPSPNGLTISSMRVEVLNQLGTEVSTVTLYDDGTHQDGMSKDGVFGNAYTVPSVPGYYRLSFLAQGTCQGEPFQRAYFGGFIVLSTTPVFTGLFSDSANDTDADGKLDQIVERVSLNIPSAGQYILAGRLDDRSGYPIDEARVTFYAAVPGAVQVDLPFKVGLLGCSQFGAPFKITDLFVARSNDFVPLDRWTTSVGTRSYSGTDFGCEQTRAPALSVIGITPNSILPGETKQVILSGKGFQDGVVVSIGNGVSVSNLSWLNSNAIAFSATATSSATPGLRDVVIANPDGRSTTSPGLFSVTTDQPPIVSISYPTDAQIITGLVTVSASATDDAEIQKVEFYLDGVLSSTDTTFPYQFVWNTLASTNGPHNLTAKAYDTTNKTSTTQINVVVNNSADLAVTKTASPNLVSTGSNVAYTITISNNGPIAATSVTVTDNLPISTNFVSCSATNGGVCSGSGNNRTVSFPSLAAGASATITLVVKTNCLSVSDPVISNTATVSSSAFDSNTSNNTATAIISAAPPQPIIEIEGGKSFFDFNSEPNGAPRSIVFTIQNNGCLPVSANFTLKRIGGDVDSGKISNPDDSVVFPIRIINTDGSETPSSSAQIFGGDKRGFRLYFNPMIPAPAGKTSGLFAHQLLPELINSALTITTNGAGIYTFPINARLATESKLINPLAPRLSPLVVLAKSGDEFAVEFSAFDSNLDIYYATFQFLDSLGRGVGDAPGFDLEQPIRQSGLLKGQSFTLVKKFTGALGRPQVTNVKVTLFDRSSPPQTAVSSPIGTTIGRVVNASAASFVTTALASESIAAAFGSNLSREMQAATTSPLPITLAGTRVFVRDSSQAERDAPLFFVAPGQINYQIPPGTAVGAATVTVASDDKVMSVGVMEIAATAPGLFAANANGQGVAAAVVLRVSGNGAQNYEPVSDYDAAQKRFVARPIDLGNENDQVYLVLFGTGLRNRSSLSTVSATIGGVEVPVLYVGPQGGFVGLDQVNLRIPRNLVGRGEVDIALRVDGIVANIVKASFR